MRYIRKDMFNLLSNMDRVIVYLLFHKDRYVGAKEIERACNICQGTLGSYLYWLRFKGIVKRRKVLLRVNAKYMYTINKLPYNKRYLRDIIKMREYRERRDGNSASSTG